MLIACRRRCCLCWLLDRDDTEKAGQIAHVDRDPSNNSEDNLAWLCLPHHEQYDRSSRQARGITGAELRHARAELLAHLDQPNPPPPSVAPSPFHMPNAQIGQATFINGPGHITIGSQNIHMPSPSPPSPPPGTPASRRSSHVARTPGGQQAFDVFLSHNGKDKPAARGLKQRLVARNLSVWLDEDELQPGIPWQQRLEEGVKASRSVAVLVSRDGLGPWEGEEMQAALRLAVKDQRPVIPVLLPGCPAQPELPLFLTNRTWVDLRAGLTESGLDRLEWGITGRKREPSGAEDAPPAPDAIAPSNPNPDPFALHPTVWEEVQALLAGDPQLSAEIQAALKQDQKQPKEAVHLLAEIINQVGVVEALNRLKNWLAGKKSVRDPAEFEKLVLCLSALGVKDCQWLESSRGCFTAKSLESLGLPAGPLDVPGPPWPFAAELVVSALKDRATSWDQQGEHPAQWKGRDYVGIPSVVDLAGEDDKTASRLERFVRNFLKRRGLPVTRLFAKDLASLKEHIHFREARHPYYTEELPDDPLFQQPQLRELLLILRRAPASEGVLDKPAGLEEVLRQLFATLRALPASSKPIRQP